MDLDTGTFSNVFNDNFTSLNNPLPFGLIDRDNVSPDTVDHELLAQLLPIPEENGGVANLDRPPVSMSGQNANRGAQSEFTNTSENAATGGIADDVPLDFSALTDDDWAQVLNADNIFSGPVETSAPQTLDDKEFWDMLK